MEMADTEVSWATKFPAWFDRPQNFGGCNQFLFVDHGNNVIEAPAGVGEPPNG